MFSHSTNEFSRVFLSSLFEIVASSFKPRFIHKEICFSLPVGSGIRNASEAWQMVSPVAVSRRFASFVWDEHWSASFGSASLRLVVVRGNPMKSPYLFIAPHICVAEIY
jgi:hypothetical protein